MIIADTSSADSLSDIDLSLEEKSESCYVMYVLVFPYISKGWVDASEVELRSF